MKWGDMPFLGALLNGLDGISHFPHCGCIRPSRSFLDWRGASRRSNEGGKRGLTFLSSTLCPLVELFGKESRFSLGRKLNQERQRLWSVEQGVDLVSYLSTEGQGKPRPEQVDSPREDTIRYRLQVVPTSEHRVCQLAQPPAARTHKPRCRVIAFIAQLGRTSLGEVGREVDHYLKASVRGGKTAVWPI